MNSPRTTSMPSRANFLQLLALPTISFLLFGFAALPLFTHAHSADPTSEQFVHLQTSGYEPRTLTIPAGTTVVFENKSTTDLWPASNIHPTHEIYSDFD